MSTTSERRWMLVLTDFPARLLLTGAVVTAVTASAGTVAMFPARMVVPARQAPAPQAPVQKAPTTGVPPTPPQADGSGLAELGTPSRSQPPPRPPRPARTATPPPVPDAGLTEADWARLPPALREQVREACAEGYLTGPHCAHA